MKMNGLKNRKMKFLVAMIVCITMMSVSFFAVKADGAKKLADEGFFIIPSKVVNNSSKATGTVSVTPVVSESSNITSNVDATGSANCSTSNLDAFVNIAAKEVGQGRDANNITKYGQWYQDKIDSTDAFATAPWCAMFLSWCANEAGITDAMVGYYAECDYWKNGFYVANGLWHDASGYTPKKGDLLFFDNHNNDNVADHNGIVEKVTDTEVVIIEGNYNDKVERVTYNLKDEKILGYGTPDYNKTKQTTGTRQHTQNPTGQSSEAKETTPAAAAPKATESTSTSSSGAQKMLDVARGQIGYAEDGSEWTPYGQWYQDNIDSSWNFATAEWCAMFVSWCANKAGFSSNVIKPYASCYAGEANFQAMGVWHAQGSGYTPKPGDIIFFTGGSHTGIVEKCENGVVYTIEGNYLETVSRASHSINSGKISGYGSPRY